MFAADAGVEPPPQAHKVGKTKEASSRRAWTHTHLEGLLLPSQMLPRAHVHDLVFNKDFRAHAQIKVWLEFGSGR